MRTDRMVTPAAISCLAAVASLLPSLAQAQAPSRVAKWMGSAGVSIRKTFDGTKEEQNPASIFYYRESTGSDPEVTAIDVAVKFLEKELLKQTSQMSLIVYPVVDYHRSSNTTSRVSKAGLTGRTEFRPWGLGTAPAGSRALFLPLALTVIADAKVARDWKSRTDETRYGGQLFLTSVWRGGPGAPLRDGSGNERFRYYPYVGADRYRFAGATTDTNLTVGFARLWADSWLVVTDSGQYVQLTGDLAARHRLSRDEGIGRQLADAAVGLNYYPDGTGNFGIGIEYANGRDASKRFARRERTALSFKVKF